MFASSKKGYKLCLIIFINLDEENWKESSSPGISNEDATSNEKQFPSEETCQTLKQ